MPDLTSIATQAITDLDSYNQAATKVTQDQAQLTSDQATAQSAAGKAQQSCSDAIQAFTSALANLPPAPVSTD